MADQKLLHSKRKAHKKRRYPIATSVYYQAALRPVFYWEYAILPLFHCHKIFQGKLYLFIELESLRSSPLTTPFQPAEVTKSLLKQEYRYSAPLPSVGAFLFTPTEEVSNEITRREHQGAREVQLVDFLNTYRPGELVRKSRDEYCTKSHSSLRITPSKNLFHWCSQSKGGRGALDYLLTVEGMSFARR